MPKLPIIQHEYSVLVNQPFHSSLTSDKPRLTQLQTYTILKKENIQIFFSNCAIFLVAAMKAL